MQQYHTKIYQIKVNEILKPLLCNIYINFAAEILDLY